MLELLFKRRSIRKYKDISIEKDKVDKLIKAALLSHLKKYYLGNSLLLG